MIMFLVYAGKWFILHVVFGQIEPEVMRNCSIYLLIVTASIPFLAVYNSGAAMYRAMGDSRTPMLMSLAMNGMNLIGNAILLYGVGMGVEGAAIPTMLSRVFAGVWMLFCIRDNRKMLHVRTLSGIRLKWPVLKKILHLGIPYSLENSMFQLGKILVLSLVSGFGTSSIAANAVCNSVCSFAILGGMSMGYALSAVSAQCVGAGDYEQVRFYTRKLIKYAYGAIFSHESSDYTGASFYYPNLQSVFRDRGNGKTDYYLSCGSGSFDLDTVIYAAEHFACGERCGILYVGIHCVHVDFPYRLPALFWENMRDLACLVFGSP